MQDMVDYIHIYSEGSGGSKMNQIVEPKWHEKLNFDEADWEESGLKFNSAIPNFISRREHILKRDAEPAKIERKTIQGTISGAIGTLVHWWKEPVDMVKGFTGMLRTEHQEPIELVKEEVKRDDEEALPVYFDIRPGTLLELKTQSIAPLHPVLHENMETPIEARRQVRLIGKFCVSPIQSQLEQDKGLTVLLTDQFRPVKFE